jgi:hypothetical protein
VSNRAAVLNYEPLPTHADLCVAALEYGLEMAQLHLHVHPLCEDRAREIISSSRIAENCTGKSVTLVLDDSLNNNEWYIELAIGSDPDEGSTSTSQPEHR